jgi:eukaryotic-like serine/threonine-protein kinase
MDECCQRTHAKLLAGICPWCGQTITNGMLPEARTTSAPLAAVLPQSGISLKDLVTRAGSLDVITAAQHVEEVAKQLEEIHDSGQLHRNVSPDQIFVDETGIARLTVSPISSLFEADTLSLSADAERAVLGSVDFLAPEAALQWHSNDARSDIYSLGCTMYFLLTGRPPFPNGSVSERLLKHQTATPDAIQTLREDVPVALVTICEMMMAKKPSERIQTAKEVGDTIAAWRTKLNQPDP